MVTLRILAAPATSRLWDRPAANLHLCRANGSAKVRYSNDRVKDGLLFGIGEVGYALSLDDGLSLASHLPQNRRAMTDGRDRIAGIVEALDEGNRVSVVGGGPTSMTARCSGSQKRQINGTMKTETTKNQISSGKPSFQ